MNGKRLAACLIAVLVLATLSTSTAWGQTILDPQLAVSGSCGTGLFNQGGSFETNGICNGTSLTITDLNNANAINGPTLVILGIPGGAGTAPTLTFNNVSYQPTGTAVFGLNTTSFPVTFNAGNVCSLLGLTNDQGCASESFSNWASADAAVNGFTPTSFGVYVYVLPTGISPKGSINLGFNVGSGGLPLGSFVVAYGCVDAISNNDPCPNGHTGFTPFTNAGITNTPPVPEPATMTLFGSGLLGIGGYLRRRWRSGS